MDLHEAGVQAFEDDIIHGELITGRLMQRVSVKEKYFRHPYLHLGKTLAIKREIDAFLAKRGYQIAPVTITLDDEVFAAAYDVAELDGDRERMDRVGAAYLKHAEKAIAAAERLANEAVQRSIRHIAMMHANALNARYFQEVVRAFGERGYRFISLPEALQDEVYRSPDGGYAANDAWPAYQMSYMWAAARAKSLASPLPSQARIPPSLVLPDSVVHPRQR